MSNSNKLDLTLRDKEFFQCLADTRTPKGALGASIGAHIILVLVLIALPLLAPQALHLNYRTTMLAPPPEPPRHVDETPLKLPPRPKPLPKPPVLTADNVPVPKMPTPEPVRVPEVAPKPAPVAVTSVPPPVLQPKTATVAPPQPTVLTNVFSSATPTAAPSAPARNAEAAGFGDVNGARATAHAKTENIAKLGGFDVGPGEGSRGTTGNHGTVSDGGFSGSAAVRSGTPTRGALADAGFGGSATAKASAGTRAPISDAGFSAAATAPKTPAAARKPDPGEIDKPVEITVKPRPDYTEEARKMRIEGEVSLRILFTASGEARVLDVLQGLGYGLNDNAIRAAQHIRFKPAQRQGQPVDSTAIV